ncbi:hypothetical protein EC991_002613 [Linnemannia zychae]|nr:hypothetical protein EC991_002613 [Linnemannia zychae]
MNSQSIHSPLLSVPSSSNVSSCASSPFCSSESGAELDILDLPVSMFFPTKLTDSGSSPSLSGPTVGYTQSLVELNTAQNALLFSQQQQQQQQNQHLHFQQLQQLHQQQQLQYEMAHISLGSPRTPTTPVNSITIPEHGSQGISPIHMGFPSSPAVVSSSSISTAASSPMAPTLSTITSNGAPTPIHHPALSQFQSSYHSAPRQTQQQQQSPISQTSLQNPISSPYFSQTDSPFVTDAAVFGTSDVHDIDLFPLNPVTSSMPNHVQSIIHNPFSPQEFTPGHLTVPAAGSSTVTSAHGSPILPLDCVKHERLSPTIQPLVLCNCPDKYPCGQLNHTAPTSAPLAKSLYSVIGEDDEYGDCYSSSSSERAGSDDGIDAGLPSQLPSSTTIGAKPSSSSSTFRLGTQRPKSMLVTSSSFSFSGQPYESPFHKDSPMVAQPRPRRSSSGTFAYYSPATATSLPTYTFGAGHLSSQQQQHNHHNHYQHHQHQGQSNSSSPRPSIIHHPQQQYVQHLLDPEMVPKITDIHVCPVCQRRFSRPFNLRSHIMTHTTSRPFPCDECHWRFSRQHDLLRHKRAKHPGSVPPLPPKAPKVKTETKE